MCHEKEGAEKLENRTEETDQLREVLERAVQEQESQKEAESQKGAERQERRICLSTKTQAQRQVLEEMMPQREGQGADTTCGITIAVDACLKGGVGNPALRR